MTGSELVRGDRNDLNGPFYAREAVVLGLEPARISIVGDRADELEDAIREGLRAEICLISGGLGPTGGKADFVAAWGGVSGLQLALPVI